MKNEYTRPEYYENRELSWLGFDERILSEARDKSIPLFERLKFLSITASNLDEFFMVRVASLLDMVNAEYKGKDIPNKVNPKVYSFGLVTIGENSVIPPNVQIGLNTAISGPTESEDYPNGILASGETLIKAGDRS